MSPWYRRLGKKIRPTATDILSSAANSVYRAIYKLERERMNDMTEIAPGLFMGGAISGRPADIQAIVDLQIEHEDILRPTGLHAFLWLPIEDTPAAAPGPHWLDNVVNTISGWRRVNWNTLIHCKAGHSRSGLVTVAYAMKTYSFTRDAALAFVRAARPVCSPNAGFMNSLADYEIFLKG